jgi:hypothetical protein
MALPKIDAPTYEITLPVSKKQLKFRPFLVKEQKILLMAMETGEKEIIENNIKQILQNCAISDFDVDATPIVDIEYYFLNLRARSVGEIVETKYKCENVVNSEVCGNVMDTKFNLLDIELEIQNELAEDTIVLSGDVGIKMKYPDFAVVEKLQQSDSVTDSAFEFIIECIDYIYDSDNVYYAHETPQEEIQVFLESLTKEQFEKIETFVDRLPKLSKKIEATCKKCGFHHTINVEGLEDFFV